MKMFSLCCKCFRGRSEKREESKSDEKNDDVSLEKPSLEGWWKMFKTLEVTKKYDDRSLNFMGSRTKLCGKKIIV